MNSTCLTKFLALGRRQCIRTVATPLATLAMPGWSGLALALLFPAAGHCTAKQANTTGFYKGPPLFSVCPDEMAPLQSIDRFGPVGIGIELYQPAFVMKVKNIEKGSPAEAAGKLKAGQIIETLNGQKLANIDPRIQLGQIISAAEATDGVVKFMVKDTPEAKAEEVIVKIPVLGAYSKTWPLHCPKSDKIVRGFVDYLAKPGSDQGFSGTGMLFLLSTGEEKDLEAVRKWAQGLANKDTPAYSWHLGYGGIPLTEYYLRTGDQTVLPTIQKWVDSAAQRQYLGGWSQRGGVGNVNYGGGGGHLNAGGTAVVTFLMLAKECGAQVTDYALHSALVHFYRFAGRGNNPYGDNRPEAGFVDNGKNGNLAFAMAAAASLTPDGEKSIYAGARDAAALTSFYTTTYMLHGHTGGGIGETWRSAAMGLLHDKKPAQYREFMNNRQWHYDLSRRWDGSFGILGGARYDNTEWGAAYALTYTIPRKTLRITGAPPSKFSKKYQLPVRPWGTQADDAFASIEAAATQNGKRPDFSKETLAENSAKGVLERFTQSGLSDDMLRQFAHHPDHAIRQIAANKAMGINSTYLGKGSTGAEKRPALVLEFLKSPDPRVRRAILDAITTGLRGDASENDLTPEVFDLVIGMLKDPGESWWVKDSALILVGRAPVERIIPHVDLLIGYLKHEEWWLQNAALTALTPVVADEGCYRKVLPAIGDLLRTCQRWNATSPVRGGNLPAKLHKASPEVRQLAVETLKGAFTGYAGVKMDPTGQDITTVFDSHMEFLATALAGVPGGYDVLYEIAKQRYPDESLPYAKIFLAVDSEAFGPKLRQAIQPIIMDRLIPEYFGRNLDALLKEAQSSDVHNPGANRAKPKMADLVALYDRGGIKDYDWHDFGPDQTEFKWDYHSFDPPEEKLWICEWPGWRYRKVTFPKGMENWFAPDFDAKKAGWKSGFAPFGQANGKLVTDKVSCNLSSCRCGTPMKTLWEKEVLLIRGTFKLPKFREGYRYRLLFGGISHVGAGDGFRVYVNGKLLDEKTRGVERREGGQEICSYIDKTWWPDFQGGEVTIAATGFLKIQFGNKIKGNHFSLWFEEMKVPPLGEKEIIKSASTVPMLSSDWQAKQDPDDTERKPNDDTFHWDGKFVANPKVIGSWTTLDQVASIDGFTPEKKMNPGRPLFTAMTFKDQGLTASGTMIWSGDTLMDLDRYQALKMTFKTIGGSDFLFVEAGGFSDKNPSEWQSPWIVMKRNGK